MANHPSALKRHLQSLKRNIKNRAARSKLATQVKKARIEISAKQAFCDKGEIQKAVSLLAKSAKKGVIKKKNAARRISRLMKQANQCQSK